MHGHSVVQSANSYEAWKFGALLSVEHGGSNGYQWGLGLAHEEISSG
jgi:hypothetical protein